MMAEYIEREKVYDIFAVKQQKLLKYHRYYQLNDADKEEFDLYDSYMNEVESIPSADVVEVKHGKWEWYKDHWECSVCRGSRFHDLVLGLDAAHCGYCGAKMGGDKDA